MSVSTVTYAGIIMYLASEKVGQSFKIGRGTSRVYISRFRNHVLKQGRTLDEEVDALIFAPISDHDQISYNCDPSMRSILVLFYKAYLAILQENLGVGRFELLEYCLKNRIFNKNAKYNYDILNNKNVLEIITMVDTGQISSAGIEELLYIPPMSLKPDVNIILLASIPDEWWPENFRGSSKAEARAWVRKIWMIGSEKRPLEKARIDFLRAVESVRNEEHLTPDYKRRRDYRAQHPRVPVQIAGRIAEEFDDLVRYKTVGGVSEGVHIKVWGKETAQIHRTLLKGYMSYVATYHIRDIDGPNGPLENKLSIAYYASFEYLQGFINDSYMAAGKYNHGVEKLVKTVKCMLAEESGWLWRRDFLVTRLPIHLQKEIEVQGGWKTYCLQVKQKLHNFYRTIQSRIEKSVKSESRIKSILDSDLPLKYIFIALDQCKRDLSSRYEKTPRFALEFQEYVLMVLISCFPLRAKNWSLMKYGNIDMNASRLYKDKSGVWNIVVPVKDLKNGYSSKQLMRIDEVVMPIGDSELFQEHSEMIETYLRDYRPLLTHSSDLFVGGRGHSMRPEQISDMVYEWSEKYMSMFSSSPSKIEDTLPFRAHLMRSIVATHYCKVGDVAKAALLLLDSEDVIRQHYVHDDINQKLRRELSTMTMRSVGL